MLTYLRKKMKTIMIAVAVIFAASMFYGISMTRFGAGGGAVETKALAKLNGREIDPYRYQEILNRVVRQFGGNVGVQDLPFVKNLALQQTIDFMLVLSEAKRKTRILNQEVNMMIENIVKQEKFSSRKDLEKALKRAGLTMPKFKELLRDELLAQKMISKVREEVKVTPDDLREVKASHILVTTEAEAKALLERIKKGEDFLLLAKKYSKDTGSGSRGGDLGYFSTGSMVEPFEKAAFGIPVGELSNVVKTSFGYHIIKVTDSRLRKFPGSGKDIEKAALAMKQQTAFQKWLSEQRSKARVEIINPELLAHDLRFKGQIFEAIEEYKKAIAKNPSSAFLHICLGDTYGTIGKTDLALSSYQSAVDREGGNPDLYIILGQAYEKAGQKDEAARQYKRASLVAGEDKAKHEELLQLFKGIKSIKGESEERAEIRRIAKKEKFEKELKGEK